MSHQTDHGKKMLWGILILTIVVRLYHVSFPVAGFQAWRQADTAAMTRNFFEQGFDFFYPQIDWGGNTAGYVETEFPLYSFLAALLYKVFFPHDMWGRIISICAAVLTVGGLYLLVKKVLNPSLALWSAFLYAILPLNIFYTRAFMPESMMLMCSVWGVYYFAEWIDSGKLVNLFLSAVFISTAALLKIPALYLGLPLLHLARCKFGRAVFTHRTLWGYAIMVLVPVTIWYYHAHQIYLQSGWSFGIWFVGQDKWGMIDPLLTVKFYNDIFFKSIAERHLTYAALIPFVVGLFLQRTTKQERVFDWWLLAVLIYFAIIPIGNQVHEYYQLPFMLPAVVYVAKTFDRFLPGPDFRAALKSRGGGGHYSRFALLPFPFSVSCA